VTPEKKHKLDMDLFWEEVNRFLTPDILQITQKIHFFSEEILHFEENKANRPPEIDDRTCRLALSEGYSDLGLALASRSRSDLAHIAFLYAIELDVRNFLAFHGIGRLARAAENYPFAIRSFKLALDINPDYFPSCLELGECFEKVGEPGQALKAYGAIPFSDKLYGPAQLGLFRVLATTNQVEKGWTLLESHKAMGRLTEFHEQLAGLLSGTATHPSP
jgi:tetratricopeptide (TPR) repeat protein